MRRYRASWTAALLLMAGAQALPAVAAVPDEKALQQVAREGADLLRLAATCEVLWPGFEDDLQLLWETQVSLTQDELKERKLPQPLVRRFLEMARAEKIKVPDISFGEAIDRCRGDAKAKERNTRVKAYMDSGLPKAVRALWLK